MKQKNSYFQIEWRGTEGICHIHPPLDDGELINYKELTRFLDEHGFEAYNGRELSHQLVQREAADVSVGQGDGLAFSECMDIRVSLDKMKAVCRFYPPSVGGKLLTVNDILAKLQSCGVKYGISQDAISDFLKERCYCTDYLMAVGEPPVHGRDAKIEYYFNTNPSLKPKHNDDGSVDYHELNMICHVQEGDLLAKLYPEDRGKPGMDITGKSVPPRNVRTRHLDFGKNIRINEDKTELYSDVTGHVSLYNDKVFVSNVYEVPADVDNSTGNINYNGNIHILGSVRSGFNVYADGDIIIEGVVEDARVQAGGQIIIKCGVHGMQKGEVIAEGNIITKFIENAKVYSGGYIETGSIIGSDVAAGEDILVEEKKGFIAGGTLRAGGKVEAHNIGSAMGASTYIEVGTAPEKKERYAALQKEISELRKSIERIQPVLETYTKYIQNGKQLDDKNQNYYNTLLKESKEKKAALGKCEQEYQSLNQIMTVGRHAKVVVRRDIHPGVIIAISDVSHTVKSKRSFCSFEKKKGEIIVTPL